jgi:hypothetical protein
MTNAKPIQPFSPEDMKRRRKRAIIMAVCLVGFIVLFYITTVVKIAKIGTLQ